MFGARSLMWASTTLLSAGLRWDVETFYWTSGPGPSSWLTEHRLIRMSLLHMCENYGPKWLRTFSPVLTRKTFPGLRCLPSHMHTPHTAKIREQAR